MPPRPRQRGADMGGGKCTMTMLGREDGVERMTILHKTRRHVHQIAVDAIPHLLSARCTDGGVKLHRGKQGTSDSVLILCGAPLSGNQTCKCWVGISQFQWLARRVSTVEDTMQCLWFRANERAGKVAYCPRSACSASSGFILEDSSVKRVNCPCCNERWCRDCNEDHDGVCGGEAHENVQRCPDCGMGTYKDVGCDHMQCTCGCYFCYVCGMRITDKYNYHVRYSPEHGTYVCPQRIGQSTKKNLPGIQLDPDNQIFNQIYSADDPIIDNEGTEMAGAVIEWTGPHHTDAEVWGDRLTTYTPISPKSDDTEDELDAPSDILSLIMERSLFGMRHI